MRIRPNRTIAVLFLIVLAALGLAACGHTHSTASGASSAKADVKAIASASANVAAETTVKTDVSQCVNSVSTVKLLSSAGRQKVITCLEKLVPPAKRQAFEQCVASTAAADKVWTHSGRQTFEDSGVAHCVNQVAPKPIVSASKPTKSSKVAKAAAKPAKTKSHK